MTPEVAIELGRLIANAGADPLVNQVIGRGGVPEANTPPAN